MLRAELGSLCSPSDKVQVDLWDMRSHQLNLGQGLVEELKKLRAAEESAMTALVDEEMTARFSGDVTLTVRDTPTVLSPEQVGLCHPPVHQPLALPPCYAEEISCVHPPLVVPSCCFKSRVHSPALSLHSRLSCTLGCLRMRPGVWLFASALGRNSMLGGRCWCNDKILTS